MACSASPASHVFQDNLKITGSAGAFCLLIFAIIALYCYFSFNFFYFSGQMLIFSSIFTQLLSKEAKTGRSEWMP